MQNVMKNTNRFWHEIETQITRINDPKNRWWLVPLFAFIVTRAIVFFGAYLAEVAIPNITNDAFYHVNPNNVFLDVWARWDSAFYLSIAENGYFFILGQQSSVAFFPLYPLMINVLAPILGSTLAAGIFVSNLFLYFALIFLYKLTEFEFDSDTAGRAVFYIAAFPTAFFFTAVYTESTYLLTSIGTIYFARKRMWAWALLFGLMCSASRIVGVVVWGVVGLEWMMSHGWTFSTIHKPQAWRNLFNGIRTDFFNLITILLIPLGLISYMVFLNNQFGDPIAFSTTQSAWGREMLGPIAILYRDIAALIGGDFLRGEIWYHVILDLGGLFAVIAITFAMWRRLGTGYALFCLLSILIPTTSGTQSLSRYALVIFPVFMMLAYWGRRAWLDRLILIVFSVLLGILTTVFVNWVFVA